MEEHWAILQIQIILYSGTACLDLTVPVSVSDPHSLSADLDSVFLANADPVLKMNANPDQGKISNFFTTINRYFNSAIECGSNADPDPKE
jgi:hypothetical protein